MKFIFGLKKCPKCGKKPNVKYGDVSKLYYGDHATYIMNYFYIKCCGFLEFGSKKSYALEIWNNQIKKYKRNRKYMKLEILNENVKQDKEKILFKLADETLDCIKLVFKKNSEDNWRELIVISQDGSIKFDTKHFNRNFIKDE